MSGVIGLALAVALAVTAVPAAGATTAVLTAVTFNLLHGGGTSGLTGDDQELELRLDMAADELRRLSPDIVALQESSVSRRRGNVAARLATQLGYAYVYAPATPRRVFSIGILGRLAVWIMNFEEGPAVLSRFPIRGHTTHDLPRCVKFFEARVALRVDVETPAGTLAVISTHLSPDACQMRRIAELAQQARGALPALVMGDFNHTDTSEPIQALVRDGGFVDVFRAANPEDPGATDWQQVYAPAPTVWQRVDFMFLVPGTHSATEVRGSRVVFNTPRRLADGRTLWPSDHYGVLGEIVIVPRSQGTQR
jgi:endonuclease/exonuclease/phosphatase family metal-dependent hydrolase